MGNECANDDTGGLLTRKEFNALRLLLVCMLVAVVIGFALYLRSSADTQAQIDSSRVACQSAGGALIVNADKSTACVAGAKQ